jgi:biopolymer transport protein ExbD
MSMSLGPSDGGEEDEVISTINTTPLVDVMLVLLIIFLITIPVVRLSVAVELPKEENLPTVTKPENVLLSVSREGDVYWNMIAIKDSDDLLLRLKSVSVLDPQPEVHIRGDLEARYEAVGQVVFACQRAGIVKIGFITEPPERG